MAAQLWLLRHGEAVPHGSKPDEDRELTRRGERQAEAAGAALAALGEIESPVGPIVLIVTGHNIDDELHRRAVEEPESFPD